MVCVVVEGSGAGRLLTVVRGGLQARQVGRAVPDTVQANVQPPCAARRRVVVREWILAEGELQFDVKGCDV